MSSDLKDAFNFNDRAGNGKITFTELESGLRCLGKMHTSAELKELLQEMSKTDQDSFSFEEFCAFHDRVKRDLSNSKELVKQAFEVFDKNKDGFLNSNELRMILTSLGEKLTEEDINKLISKADPDGTGRVDYNEFVTRMSEYIA